MQLVLSNNRVIAHGSGYIALGGVVVKKTTGEKYDNATIAECSNCPSDIDKVGYEYHAGVFVPCAPYGKGNNNGYFMEVCEECATPRNSGIPIKGGIKLEHLNKEITANALGGAKVTLLWENASPNSDFAAQTVTLASDEWDILICEATEGSTIIPAYFKRPIALFNMYPTMAQLNIFLREIEEITTNTIKFKGGTKGTLTKSGGTIGIYYDNQFAIPLKIYGVKI